MYSTAYNLWTFTWFVHFELPFRLKGTEKIHTERFFKFPSNIYSILYGNCPSLAISKLYSTHTDKIRQNGTVRQINNLHIVTFMWYLHVIHFPPSHRFEFIIFILYVRMKTVQCTFVLYQVNILALLVLKTRRYFTTICLSIGQ